MHNTTKPTHPKAASGTPSLAHATADKQREANAGYLKKLANDRKKLDELQNTQTVLQQKLPKLMESNKDGMITKATLAYSLLSDLIDECIYDVLFEAHRDIKQAKSICQICQTRCRAYVSRPGCDIYGNSYQANNLPAYECVNCHKMIAAGRYAPHLEKCLGLAGRQSSRVASRR
ncbi:hypothetical protein BX666DRAFT_1225752 [Dichotomocladium elegans]|nr:hypothetical protein BX666DRAFT_1225752 [Dichotomocladium elegans]